MARSWSPVIWTDGRGLHKDLEPKFFRYWRLEAHPNNEERSSAKNPGINSCVDAHATFKPYLGPSAEFQNLSRRTWQCQGILWLRRFH